SVHFRSFLQSSLSICLSVCLSTLSKSLVFSPLSSDPRFFCFLFHPWPPKRRRRRSKRERDPRARKPYGNSSYYLRFAAFVNVSACVCLSFSALRFCVCIFALLLFFTILFYLSNIYSL